MGKSKNASKPLTQEEIWDDSALVQSWDEAVEEYKVPPVSLSMSHVIYNAQRANQSTTALPQYPRQRGKCG